MSKWHYLGVVSTKIQKLGVTFEEGFFANFSLEITFTTHNNLISHVTKESLFRRRLGLYPPSELSPGEL